jgi:uncharacterized repeat protein (TIGR03806 family)
VKLLIISVAFFIACLSFQTADEEIVRREKLSEYNFFQGALADLLPAPGVVPYGVNTPLFSNYAEKLRFIRLPAGKKAAYNDSVVFELPQGTVLIKNFYYPRDFRKPDGARFLLETRLLVHTPNGWEAWPYVWNEEQTEAFYDPAGEAKMVSYTDKKGKKVTTQYLIPNKNQCKGCHTRGDNFQPIGVNARQLNGAFAYPTGTQNQLTYWAATGMIDLPAEVSQLPRLAVWDDASTGDLNSRARAYLDANCGHCHSRTGPANTSGLFLDIHEQRPVHLGVNKAPVAAGRGSGNFSFDIVPGQPQRSILIYRMKANDPAIAMPEIGREQVHIEGVALIEEWIRKHTF